MQKLLFAKTATWTARKKVKSWAKMDLENRQASRVVSLATNSPCGHGRPVHGGVAVGPQSAAVGHRGGRLPRGRGAEPDGRLPQGGEPPTARPHARRPERLRCYVWNTIADDTSEHKGIFNKSKTMSHKMSIKWESEIGVAYTYY